MEAPQLVKHQEKQNQSPVEMKTLGSQNVEILILIRQQELYGYLIIILRQY